MKLSHCLCLSLVLSSFSLSCFAGSNSESVGDALEILMPATAFGLTWLKDDDEGRNEFYRSFATNLIATELLKHTVNKQRPDNNGDKAFPSGHTSSAFQAATFVQMRYGPEYGIPAYLLASYVAVNRVNNRQHDWQDVTAGALIGIASSYWFTTEYHGMKITPSASAGQLGINVSARF